MAMTRGVLATGTESRQPRAGRQHRRALSFSPCREPGGRYAPALHSRKLRHGKAKWPNGTYGPWEAEVRTKTQDLRTARAEGEGGQETARARAERTESPWT